MKQQQLPIAQEKNSSFLVTLLSVLLLISVFIAGFFAYQTQNLVKELTKLQVTPTSLATSTPDPIANWKVYVNNKFGYEVKLPQEYVVGYADVIAGKFNEADGNEDTLDILPTEHDEFKKFIQIQIIKSSSITEDFLSHVNNNYKKQQDHFQTTEISQVKEGKYFGYPGYEYSFSGQSMYTFGWDGQVEQGEYLVTVFQRNQYTYLIVRRNDQTLNQIISTLKFVVPTVSSSPVPVACTMEAKICPNGSAVGRSGPNCEFAPCPTTSPQL